MDDKYSNKHNDTDSQFIPQVSPKAQPAYKLFIKNGIPIRYIVTFVCVCLVIISIVILQSIKAINASKQVFAPEKEIVYIEKPPEIKRLQIGEVIINSVTEEQKLQVLSSDVSEELLLDDSFKINWKIFKKTQIITIKGTSVYTVDLRNFSRDDIAYDAETGKLFVLIPRPVLESVTINEEQNEFQEVEKGWFRFGDIEMSPEDYNEIMRQGKEEMTNKLKLDIEMQIKAEEAAKKAMTDLINSLFTSADITDYKLEIGFK